MSRFDDGRTSGGPRSSGSGSRDEPARGDQDKSWRGSGGGEGFRGSRGGGGAGGGRSDDRASGDRGGGSWRGAGGGDRASAGGDRASAGGGSSRFGATGGSSAGGTGGSAAPSGQRPRLNLKPRTVDGAAPAPSGVASTESKLSKMSVGDDKEKDREPVSMNSRAAALGSAPEYRHSQLRQEGRPDRAGQRASGPPPVANKRIAQLADEEREKSRDREQSRVERNEGPPEPVGSSRFARDERGPPPPRETGPPPTTNSRFAAAAAMAKQEDSTREPRGPSRFSEGGGAGSFSRNSGPPPTQNSRFAAAAAADSDYGDRGDRDNRGPPRFSDDRTGGGGGGYNRAGPPPTQNSRFAAAAESDQGDRGDRGGPRGRDGGGRDGGGRDGGGRDGGGRGFGRDDRGGYGRDRDDRGDRGGYGRDRDDRGGYGRDRDDRGGYGRDRDDRGGYGRDDRGGYGRDDRGGYGRGDDRRQGDGGRGFGGDRDLSSLPRGPRSSQTDDLPTGPRSSATDNSSTSLVDELLKPKMASLAESNALKLPAAPVHSENILKVAVPLKKKDEEELFIVAPKKKVEEKPKEAKPTAPSVPAEKGKELLAEFASGRRKGEELKSWVDENRESLPTVDQLVFAMLVEQNNVNPDPECKWAEPDNFGAALLSLVEDDIVGQMMILWGIQFYCDKIGFPKLKDEYIIQSMFRAMYKYDLAEQDAFTEWKEDETEACGKGKLNAIIQTVNWFTWLDQVDDDEEEEEEEEVGEEEG